MEGPDGQLFLALARGRVMRSVSWMRQRYEREGRAGLV